MLTSVIGSFAPLALIFSALVRINVVSLLFLLAFGVVQLRPHRPSGGGSVWGGVILLAAIAVAFEAIVEVVFLADNKWPDSAKIRAFLELLGLSNSNPWVGDGDGPLSGVLASFLAQLLVALTAACALYSKWHLAWNPGDPGGRWHLWRQTLVKVGIPAAQLAVGLAVPSWTAALYFSAFCVGLLHWAVSARSDGLSWTWRGFQVTAGCHLLLLYLYQLPSVDLLGLEGVATRLGIYRLFPLEVDMWLHWLQAAALLALYCLLSMAIQDRNGGDNSMSRESPSVGSSPERGQALEASLAEPLLPPSHGGSSTDRPTRVFKETAAEWLYINAYVYGLPLFLAATVGWTAVCVCVLSLLLLVYVTYVLVRFPKPGALRTLHGVLLWFLLSWGIASYLFNVVRPSSQLDRWALIGLWVYPNPERALLANCLLPLLLACHMYASARVLKSIPPQSDGEHELPRDDPARFHGREGRRLLLAGLLIWTLRQVANCIGLVLLFAAGSATLNLLHSVYMLAFAVHLVSMQVAAATRPLLVLYAAFHYCAHYIMAIPLVAELVAASSWKPTLQLIGLWESPTWHDFLAVGSVAAFMGLQLSMSGALRSLAASVQRCSRLPAGWTWLAGPNGDDLAAVELSSSFLRLEVAARALGGNWWCLGAIVRVYRSASPYLAYIACFTVICSITPSYVGLAFLLLLLLWITARQLSARVRLLSPRPADAEDRVLNDMETVVPGSPPRVARSPLWEWQVSSPCGVGGDSSAPHFQVPPPEDASSPPARIIALGSAAGARSWVGLMGMAGVALTARYLLLFPTLRKLLVDGLHLSPALERDIGLTSPDGLSVTSSLWDCASLLAICQVYYRGRAYRGLHPLQRELIVHTTKGMRGLVALCSRLLILHCGKLLAIVAFCAAVSPVSAAGLGYMVLLVATSPMAKTSRLPAKLYATYTTLLAAADYTFQLVAPDFGMAPGQPHWPFAQWAGMIIWNSGTRGVGVGLRSKLVVLTVCALQHATFQWLESMPAALRSDESGEPCVLFAQGGHMCTRTTSVNESTLSRQNSSLKGWEAEQHLQTRPGSRRHSSSDQENRLEEASWAGTADKWPTQAQPDHPKPGAFDGSSGSDSGLWRRSGEGADLVAVALKQSPHPEALEKWVAGPVGAGGAAALVAGGEGKEDGNGAEQGGRHSDENSKANGREITQPQRSFEDTEHTAAGGGEDVADVSPEGLLQRQKAREREAEVPETSSMSRRWYSERGKITMERQLCRRWSKRALHMWQRRERFRVQLAYLYSQLRHVVERFALLYGLELCMLGLLVAAFAVKNVYSLAHITLLGLCLVLPPGAVRSLWPLVTVLFAGVLLLQYYTLVGTPPLWWTLASPPAEEEGHRNCQECWMSTDPSDSHCWSCWLGTVVDDRNIVAAHYLVFFLASVQLRAQWATARMLQRPSRVGDSAPRRAWLDLSDARSAPEWTWLDQLRFLLCRHLLHVVLVLVFVTGTLEYDLLHFGYMALALGCLRLRGALLRRRTIIFTVLRVYNFVLITASLLYQAPLFPYTAAGSCEAFTLIGLYKYDYGFRITARSAVVDMTIFLAIGLQCYMFRSDAFRQLVHFLDRHQEGERQRAQVQMAEWKREHLRYLRQLEDRKAGRRSQVRHMKEAMAHLQLRLDLLNAEANRRGGRGHDMHHPEERDPAVPPASHQGNFPLSPPPSPDYWGQYPDASTMSSSKKSRGLGLWRNSGKSMAREESQKALFQEASPAELMGSLAGSSGQGSGRPPQDLPPDPVRARSTSILQGVLGNGVAQVKSWALAGLEGFLDMEELQRRGGEGGEDTEPSTAANSILDLRELELEHKARQVTQEGIVQQAVKAMEAERVQAGGGPSVREGEVENWKKLEQGKNSKVEEEEEVEEDVEEVFGLGDGEAAASSDDEPPLGERAPMQEAVQRESAARRIVGRMLWAARNHSDVVTGAFMVAAFCWDFSVLTLVFPIALFCGALVANPCAGPRFWSTMLIYAEALVALQYAYQIPSLDKCPYVGRSAPAWLRLLGIRSYPSMFILHVTPLFLVYLALLVRVALQAQTGQWLLEDPGGSVSQLDGPNRPLPHSLSRALSRWRSFVAAVRRGCQKCTRFLRGLVNGSEAPPYFVQVGMTVPGAHWQLLQEDVVATGVNKLLAHQAYYTSSSTSSRVKVHAIEPASKDDDEDSAMVVMEVLHAAPPDRASPGYETLTPAADVAGELASFKDAMCLPPETFPFPVQITSVVPGGKREVDLYAYTFGVDLLAFFYVGLFYQAAVKDKLPFSDEVIQQEDQFPKDFVAVLMTMFFLIVLDRILYLSSAAGAKVAYHVATLALFTGGVMRFFWNSRLEASHTTFRCFFFLKAVSFALTALQIRYGPPHPTNMGVQFLTRHVSRIRQRGFQLYRALPFLYELRSVLDWTCTATALPLYDWLKLEDIYGSLYLVACDIKLNRSKHRLGQPQGPISKLCVGTLVLVILISVIWAPMLIYSAGNPTNFPNLVQGARMQILLDTREGTFPLYKTGGRRRLVDPGTEWAITGDEVLKSYDPQDIRQVCCYEDADSLWALPPPSQRRLHVLLGNWSQLRVQWDFVRARPVGKETVSWEEPYTFRSSQEVAKSIQEMLNGTAPDVMLPQLYPKYWLLPGTGKAHMLEDVPANVAFVGGNLTRHDDDVPWWTFTRFNVSDDDGCGGQAGPLAITVSEEVPAGVLGEALQKLSITGLYITFVLAVGRAIRFQTSGLRVRIPYENFPSCHRLIALCEDIYAARAEGELALEEGLFWTLIKIYRSPHILLEYTKFDSDNPPNKDD